MAFIVGLLLLFKASPRLGRGGNIAIAMIIAVGTAVALAGAIAGTLIPLARATSSAVALDPLNGFLIFIGVVYWLINNFAPEPLRRWGIAVVIVLCAIALHRTPDRRPRMPRQP